MDNFIVFLFFGSLFLLMTRMSLLFCDKRRRACAYTKCDEKMCTKEGKKTWSVKAQKSTNQRNIYVSKYGAVAQLVCIDRSCVPYEGWVVICLTANLQRSGEWDQTSGKITPHTPKWETIIPPKGTQAQPWIKTTEHELLLLPLRLLWLTPAFYFGLFSLHINVYHVEWALRLPVSKIRPYCILFLHSVSHELVSVLSSENEKTNHLCGSHCKQTVKIYEFNNSIESICIVTASVSTKKW